MCDYLSANDARRETDLNVNTEHVQLMTSVMHFIKEATAHGDDIVILKDTKFKKISSNLENLGYDVSLYDDYQGFTLKITW